MATVITTDERIAHIEQMLQTLLASPPGEKMGNTEVKVAEMNAEIDRLRNSIETNRERTRLAAEATRANFALFDAIMAGAR